VTVITCDTVPVCSGHMNAASMMTAQSHCCYGNCAYILLTDHAYISSATCPNAAFLCQRKLLELLWCMGRSQQVVYLTTIGCPGVRNCSIKHGWDGRCEQVTGSAHRFHVRPLVLDEAPHDLCLAAFQPAHLSHALQNVRVKTSCLCCHASLQCRNCHNRTGHGCQDMKVMVDNPHAQCQDLCQHDRIKL